MIQISRSILVLAAPQIKNNCLEARVQIVGADGLIQERAAKLLRTTADTLECQIPPFVQIPCSQIPTRQSVKPNTWRSLLCPLIINAMAIWPTRKEQPHA